jgi:hypothetical protein
MMRPLRLPLTIGLASLQCLAAGFILIPFGVAIWVAIVRAVLAGEDTGNGDGLVVALLAGLGLVGFGFIKLRRAWRYRPSDVVFGDAGVRVEGGASGGLSIAWSDVNESTFGVKEVADEKGNDRRWILVARGTEIAEADDIVEGESFRAVAQAVAARVRENEPARTTEPQAEATNVLACASCGAPVAPTADDETTCGHCNASVRVPSDVRDRVRATAKLTKQSRRAERLVQKLLDQPGASSTMLLLGLSFVVIGSAWPLTAWAFVHIAHMHALTPVRGVGLAYLPFLLVADGFFLSRLRLVDRRALGMLTTTFGAHPPAHEGEPLRCRSCLGPLPTRDTVVVECAFCAASNITAVDPRANAHRAQASAISLQEALSNRLRERRLWRLRTLASVPFFLLTALVLHDVWSAHAR